MPPNFRHRFTGKEPGRPVALLHLDWSDWAPWLGHPEKVLATLDP